MTYWRYKFCYLCNYLLVDGSVSIRSLDPKKLSEWWLENFQADFEYAGKKKRSICKFCIWDARFLNENDECSNKDSAWWPQNKRSNLKFNSSIDEDQYNKYYKRGQMKPCYVKIEKIKIPPGKKKDVIPPAFKCYFCDSTQKTFPMIHAHMLKIHPTKMFFNCDFVACVHLFFNSNEEKNQHMEEQHNSNSEGQKILRCVSCDKVYSDKSRLHTHMTTEHQNITFYKCKYINCTQYFKNEAARTQHMEAKLSKNSKSCVYCDQMFTNFKSYWSHALSMHRNIIVRCNYGNCHAYIKSEADREQHVKEVHGTSENAIKCVYCVRVYGDQTKLNAHVKFAHQKSMIKCSFQRCPDYLKSEADRQKHMEEKHQPGENLKKCVYCDKLVTGLIKHVRNEHDQIAIRCNYNSICGNSMYFRSESERDEHFEQVHLTVKVKQKVDCIYCGNLYLSNVLSLHIKNIHSAVVVRCGYIKCKQYFATQEECQNHFKEMHEEKEKAKNIFCPECSYKTDDLGYFKKHVMLIHGTEKIKCPKCPTRDKIYKSKKALDIHLKMSHGKKVSCPHCNKLIKKYCLHAHLRSESCTECKINYLCIGAMKAHKKYCIKKCRICNREFIGYTPLLKHITNEHKDVNLQELKWFRDLRRNDYKKLICKLCKHRFFNKESLRWSAGPRSPQVCRGQLQKLVWAIKFPVSRC